MPTGVEFAMMNKEDLKEAGLKQGDYMDLVSHYNGVKRMAPHFMVVAYKIPRKSIATYFPEANVLVPIDQYAKSYTPASKSVVVRVRKKKRK